MDSLQEANSLLRQQNEVLKLESESRLNRLARVEEKLTSMIAIIERQGREIAMLKMALFGDSDD